MLMLIIWTALIAVSFYYFIVKPYDYWKDRGVKQGKPFWLVGDQWGPLFGKQSVPEMVQYLYNQSPGKRYSGIYEFLSPVLIVRDPELLKQLTIKDFDHFTDHKTIISETADPLFSKNLLALTGQKWRDMRATLSPSFTAIKMKAMFVLIQESAESFVQFFLDKDEDVIELATKDTFTRFANDVIATTAFGIKVDSLREPNNEFYLMGKKTTSFKGFWTKVKLIGFTILPKLFMVLNVGLFSNDITVFFIDLVKRTIRIREEQNIVRPDMIHLLMEARKGNLKEDDDISTESKNVPEKMKQNLTDLDIAAQALLFFFAGFDTLSTALCFTSHELALNPDIQNRLREEIVATLKECDGKLTYDSLIKMKYMDMVVSEGLRKWPSAPVIDRVCTKPYTIEPTLPGEKPLHLEPGMTFWNPIYALQRDPEFFPDPDRFDPERFNDENKEKLTPNAYVPFGIGPRSCIGSRFALMEIKTVLFYTLLNFEFITVEKTVTPLAMEKELFTASYNGGQLGLKRIKK